MTKKKIQDETIGLNLPATTTNREVYENRLLWAAELLERNPTLNAKKAIRVMKKVYGKAVRRSTMNELRQLRDSGQLDMFKKAVKGQVPVPKAKPKAEDPKLNPADFEPMFYERKPNLKSLDVPMIEPSPPARITAAGRVLMFVLGALILAGVGAAAYLIASAILMASIDAA